MSRIDHICLMANYNGWMNTKLYEAAMSLPGKELIAHRKAFFGSILGTLNHLAVGDTIWLKRFATHPANYSALELVGNLPTPASLDQLLYTDVQSLSNHRRSLDQVITEWAHSITDHDLAVTSRTIIRTFMEQVRVRGVPLLHRLHRCFALEHRLR